MEGERWLGFEAARALPDTDEEVLLVPLIGHTQGHCGVAVRGDEGWLLHCGDAYFFRGEMDLDERHCPIGLRVFQSMVQMDGASRMANQLRLRELKQQHQDVTLFCAHDPVELAQLSGRAFERQGHRAQYAA